MSRARVVQLLPLWLSLVMALTPAVAKAQNPAAAEALFEQARAAMTEGSYDIACARFRDSDKLDPAVGTRFNLADCEERRGRLATAWSLFRGVISDLPADDDRRPIAEGRAKSLEPRLPRLTLQRTQSTPAGLSVRVDGVELGEGSFDLPLPMDPGEHELSLLAPGSPSPERTSFNLKEGDRNQLALELKGARGSATAESDVSLGATEAGSGSSRKRWAYVAGGVGIGGVAFGTVTGIVTLNKKSTADANCDDSRKTCNQAGVDANESGKTYGTLSSLGLGVGVVGLALGAYLFLTSPDASAAAPPPSASAAGGLSLVPHVAYQAKRGFLGVTGRF